jgi:hypothetical protein
MSQTMRITYAVQGVVMLHPMLGLSDSKSRIIASEQEGLHTRLICTYEATILPDKSNSVSRSPENRIQQPAWSSQRPTKYLHR